MIDPQEQFEQLIQHLRYLSGQDFPVNSNACTLVDENNEIAVVIELPEGSDLLLLHSMISPLPTDPDVRSGRALQLLALNGNPERLKGAWFSIDAEGGGIQLMTSSPIDSISPVIFESLLFNFIQLSDTLKTELFEEELEIASGSATPAQGLRA